MHGYREDDTRACLEPDLEATVSQRIGDPNGPWKITKLSSTPALTGPEIRKPGASSPVTQGLAAAVKPLGIIENFNPIGLRKRSWRFNRPADGRDQGVWFPNRFKDQKYSMKLNWFETSCPILTGRELQSRQPCIGRINEHRDGELSESLGPSI